MLQRLVDTRDPRFLLFLSNLCVCNDRPIPSTQSRFLWSLCACSKINFLSNQTRYWTNWSYLMASLSSSVLKWVGLISVPMVRRVWFSISAQAPPSGDRYWTLPPESVFTLYCLLHVYVKMFFCRSVQRMTLSFWTHSCCYLARCVRYTVDHCCCCSVILSVLSTTNRATMNVVLMLLTRTVCAMLLLSRLCGVYAALNCTLLWLLNMWISSKVVVPLVCSIVISDSLPPCSDVC